MHLCRAFVLSAVIGGTSFLTATPVLAGNLSAYELTWSDEFDGNALDPSKWSHRNLGPRRNAINVADSVSVGDGNLTITTYSVDDGNGGLEHRTGMIGTQETFQQAQGYWEGRIRFNSSPSMWSAFWIQSPAIEDPLLPPEQAGTEIDVMEHRAHDWNDNDVSDWSVHTVQWGGYEENHKSNYVHLPDQGVADGFHTYGVEWSEEGYSFYIDGILRWRDTESPVSERPQFAVLSSEVEHNTWAGDIPLGGYGSREDSTTQMTVDYVRVYAVAVPEPLAMGVVAPLAMLLLRRRPLSSVVRS